MLARASRALLDVLGVSQAPLLTLAELQEGVLRVPRLGRDPAPPQPAFSVGLEGIDEEAALIFLAEERGPVAGEPAAYRVPHLDEGGYRPGLHAILRSGGSPVGHAVAAAMALSLAAETQGVVLDAAGDWVPAAGASPAHDPAAFLGALRSPGRYASVTDAAAAFWARRPRQPGPSGA